MKQSIIQRYAWWISGIAALLLAATAVLDVPERPVTQQQTGLERP